MQTNIANAGISGLRLKKAISERYQKEYSGWTLKIVGAENKDRFTLTIKDPDGAIVLTCELDGTLSQDEPSCVIGLIDRVVSST